MSDEPEETTLVTPSDLDAFMSLNAIDYTDRDIDIIIAYQRQQRSQRESGVKPKRPKAAGTVKISLEALGLKKAAPPKSTPGTGGLRRI